MNIVFRFTILVVVGLLAIAVSHVRVHGQDDESSSLVAIIKAIEQGWEQADDEPFRQHFLDAEGARYIESGGQNTSLTALIEHHVKPEGDSLDNFELNLSNVETRVESDFAWTIADVEFKATVKRGQREIHSRGFERGSSSGSDLCSNYSMIHSRHDIDCKNKITSH